MRTWRRGMSPRTRPSAGRRGGFRRPPRSRPAEHATLRELRLGARHTPWLMSPSRSPVPDTVALMLNWEFGRLAALPALREDGADDKAGAVSSKRGESAMRSIGSSSTQLDLESAPVASSDSSQPSSQREGGGRTTGADGTGRDWTHRQRAS